MLYVLPAAKRWLPAHWQVLPPDICTLPRWKDQLLSSECQLPGVDFTSVEAAAALWVLALNEPPLARCVGMQWQVAARRAFQISIYSLTGCWSVADC